jgi:glycosidase
VIPFRRYGGDLQGLVARLDHLQALGVTAIYLCPVFQARSEHKYETSDHRHVDESFGGSGPPRGVWEPIAGETADPATWTWTEADRYLIDVVLPECRRRGLRVVLDGVWNHVGTQHWAFQDVLRHGRASAYADWFRVEFGDDGRVRSWVGWPDRTNGDLPEFRQTASGDLAPGPKAHVFAVTRRWMDPDGDGDPSDGIDGWRLDVAPDVGMAFWRDWHALVKAINPEAVAIGEIWMPAGDWIEAGCFDSQMNYPVAMALLDFLRGNRDAAWFAGRCRGLIGELDDHDLAQMNLMTSHDTERLASMLANAGAEYDPGRGLLRTPERYDAGRPAAETYDLVVLAYAILTAMPGSPMVFQGDELGMSGGDDPECRKPVPWPDLGPYSSADDAPDAAMVERLGAWLRLRGDPAVGPVLRFGAVEFVESGDADVVVIRRMWNGGTVVLVANRASREIDAAAALRAAGVEPDGIDVIPPRSARLWFEGEAAR